MNNNKDSLTSHLGKSIISNILQTARASLKEPTRPFTPAEAPRSLFQSSDAARPPSSYSIKSLEKEADSRRERSKQCLDPLPQEESKENRPEVLQILEDLKEHRSVYSKDQMQSLLDRFRVCLRDSKIKRTSVLSQFAKILELFTNEQVLMAAKCLLACLLENRLFFSSNLGTGTVKLIYQYSKDKENDLLLCSEGIIDILHSVLEEAMHQEELSYETLMFLFGTLKNTSNCPEVQEKIYALNFIDNISDLLNGQIVSQKHAQMLSQAISTVRNLANHRSSFQHILISQIIEKLCVVLHSSPKLQDIVLHCLRVLTIMSIDDKVCGIILENPHTMKAIQSFISMYHENLSIVTRCCYILANIVTAFPQPRIALGWECIDNVYTFALKNSVFLHTKPAIDVLVKSTRLIANIVLDSAVSEQLGECSGIIDCFIQILSVYDLYKHEELILNTLACATNLLYYDTPARKILQDDNLRLKLLAKVSPFLVQTLNEEITTEAVRILGNLSRHDSVCNELISLHIPEVLFLLLDHSNPLVPYFAMGCFINISSISKQIIYTEDAFNNLTDLLHSLALSDPELSIQVCMTLCNLCAPAKGLVPWESVAGEDTVKKLASITTELKKACDEIASEELLDLSSVLEGLVDIMPKPIVSCTYPGCGRKFPNAQLLEDHWKRRHNDS